jgi:hypothetical protein
MAKQSNDPPALKAVEDINGGAHDLSAFVGRSLKRHRLNQHLTIQDVSELSDISRGMLSRI